MILRRFVAAVLAAIVVGASTLAPAAAAPPSVRRVAGSDRYSTAAALSADTFSPNVPVAFVASGETFADALAAGPAAAVDGAPVLLSAPDALPEPVVAELRRLRPGRIVVLGGPSAVATTVAERLATLTAGSITRVAGADRFETAALLSSATFAPGVAAAFVVSGESFADGLAAGPAAAARRGPVLLVGRETLPAATASELRRLRPASLTVVGGPGVVSEAVAAELAALAPGTVRRIAGTDRYMTAALLAEESGSKPSAVILAGGATFADALAGAAAAAARRGPLLLSERSCLTQASATALARLDPGAVVVLGGEASVGWAVDRLAECPPGSPITLDDDQGATTDELVAIVRAVTAARVAFGDHGPLTIRVVDGFGEPAFIGGFARTGRFTMYLPRVREAAAAIPALTLDLVWLDIVAHEYFHTAQFALMAEAGAPEPTLLSLPLWLAEGPAYFFGGRLTAMGLGATPGSLHRALVQSSRQTTAPLRTLDTGSAVYERPDTNARLVTTALAAEYLAVTYGEESITTRFWSELGRTRNWQIALEATFGVTANQFFEDFERYRATA